MWPLCSLNAGVGVGVGWRGRRRQIEVTGEQVSRHGFSPPLSPPLFQLSWKKAFQIMMWIDVRQLSPLLGAVRHPTGQRWQHYDGLGIVIPDACHLFTSQPSLISHHGPYNLARTPPSSPHVIQDNTIHYNRFSPLLFPLTFLFSSLSLLHPRAAHSQHI